MQFTGIYAITDDKLLAPDQLPVAVDAALAAGVRLLQYRSKLKDAALRHTVAYTLNEICKKHEVPLLINDDVELCLAIGAAGVHLGRHDAELAQARARLGTDAIIGITCHSSLADALEAEKAGANYVAFGSFFASQTKPQASPAQLSLLTEARRQLKLPIVAIGGINAENGAAVLEAGADMLAVVHAVFGYKEVSSNVYKLVRLFQ